MTAPSTGRRALLGAAALAPLAAMPAGAQAALPDPGTDAELIRTCAEHRAVFHAINYGGMEGDGSPAWPVYNHAVDAISEARPRTLAGMRAKALSAMTEATDPDGSVEPCSTFGETWAWDLLEDLLRLTGGAA